jgi:hypothetical protein
MLDFFFDKKRTGATKGRGKRMKKHALACAVFCLAISVLGGSWLVSAAIRTKATYHLPNPTTAQPPRLLTQTELAAYLGISEEEARQFGPMEDGEGNTTSTLPYVKIGSTVYFYPKAVDKWLLLNEVTYLP